MVGTPVRILVLCGGHSAEREISLASGRSTVASLCQFGYPAELLDTIDPACTDLRLRQADLIVPMLHGMGGEDGSLQQRLQRLSIPWLGSSPAACELTFNKLRTRQLLQSIGIPVPAGTAVRKHESQRTVLQSIADLRWPLVVKPAEQGSSIGISIIQVPAQLPAALAEAFRWGDECLIEEFVEGREITVSLAGSQVLPLVEILPSGNWYDYAAKYQSPTTRYVVNPLQIPAALPAAAVRAVQAAGASDLTRTDIRLRADGSFAVLEINTIPGMTDHSLVPMAAAALGLTIGQLLDPLIRQKLSLHRSAA